MKFDVVDIEDIRTVFGDVGVYLAEELDYEIGSVNRVRNDDDGNVTMEITESGAADPYVRIHEFAHYYHCTLFPELSEACLQYQAEAVAFLAEKVLEDNRHIPEDWSERRTQHWAEFLVAKEEFQPLLDVVEAASGLTYLSMRDKVGLILAGGLG